MCSRNGFKFSFLIIFLDLILLLYLKDPAGIYWKFTDNYSQIQYDDNILFDFRNAEIVTKRDFPFDDNIKFEFHTKLKQENLPLAYAGKDYDCCSIYTHINTIESEVVNIFLLKYGYCANQFIGRGHQIIDMFMMYEYSPDYIHKYRFPSPVGYRYVIVSWSRYENVFGHLISDVVAPLLYVPQYIWDLKPVLFVQSVPIPLIQEYMCVIGHGDIKIISPPYEAIYAENLYIVQGATTINPCGFHAIPMLRQKIVSYYNLSAIVPTNYAFMNKDRRHRRIRNILKIMEALQNHTNIRFLHLRVNKPDRLSFAREMASLRIFIVSCGSQAYNMIFMKEKTGCITMNAKQYDCPNAKIATDLNIWNIQIIHPYMDHYGRSGLGNITRFIYSFDVMRYAVEHQQWPANHNLFAPINLTVVRQNVGDPYNYYLKMENLIREEYPKYLKEQENNTII